MEVLRDLIGFINTLTIIDLIFFFSVVLLIILIVSLIYFIKINDEVFEAIVEPEELPKEEMVYDAAEEQDLLTLSDITKALEENEDLNIDLTAYEEEQEKRAIISYDELVSQSSKNKINYEEEDLVDDITVKKVDLMNLVSEATEEEIKPTITVISYEKEEAFLKALQQLQENLN